MKAWLTPIAILISYLILFLATRSVIPSADEIVAKFSQFYSKYGYEIIFFGALSESLIILNFFVPGFVAMGMGAVFARSGDINLILVILTAILGSSLGYAIDYILGWFGFGEIVKRLGYESFLAKARGYLYKFGSLKGSLGFASPNVAAFLSLAAGTIGFSPKTFALIGILSTAFWLTLWGMLIYAVGEIFITIFTRYAFLIVLVVLLGVILTALWEKEKLKHVRT